MLFSFTETVTPFHHSMGEKSDVALRTRRPYQGLIPVVHLPTWSIEEVTARNGKFVTCMVSVRKNVLKRRLLRCELVWHSARRENSAHHVAPERYHRNWSIRTVAWAASFLLNPSRNTSPYLCSVFRNTQVIFVVIFVVFEGYDRKNSRSNTTT